MSRKLVHEYPRLFCARDSISSFLFSIHLATIVSSMLSLLIFFYRMWNKLVCTKPTGKNTQINNECFPNDRCDDSIEHTNRKKNNSSITAASYFTTLFQNLIHHRIPIGQVLFMCDFFFLIKVTNKTAWKWASNFRITHMFNQGDNPMFKEHQND